MVATGPEECTATDEAAAFRMAATFANDARPVDWRMGPLTRVATNAMAAKKPRNLFIDTSFLFAFQSSDVRFPAPCRESARNQWAHRFRITKEVYMESRDKL